MKASYLIVLNALHNGLEVKFGDHTFALMDCEDGHKRLCFKGLLSNNNGQEIVWSGNDCFTFDGFISECEKLSKNYLTSLAMSNVLTKMKRKSIKCLNNEI